MESMREEQRAGPSTLRCRLGMRQHIVVSFGGEGQSVAHVMIQEQEATADTLQCRQGPGMGDRGI